MTVQVKLSQFRHRYSLGPQAIDVLIQEIEGEDLTVVADESITPNQITALGAWCTKVAKVKSLVVGTLDGHRIQ